MYQKFTLDNGIRVLVEEIPYVRSAAVGVWVDIGSRDETVGQGGISHFIEHMMFKGTVNRTAKEIAETLDAVGGQLNAFTTKEYTCYYARILDEHLGLAIDLISDMLLNSTFAEKEVEKEKNVIIEEIKMYEDSPGELVHDIFARTIWRGHPLGRPTIGNVEMVSGLDRDTLLDYYRANYVPGNIVIAVAGNVKPDEVVHTINSKFGGLSGLPRGRTLTKPLAHSSINLQTKKTEQVHLCLGTQGLQLSDDNIYVMQVFSTLLGGGISSRLFQQIREQQGLVYSVYSYHSSYHDTGMFCVYAGLSKHNVPAVLKQIFSEINQIKSSLSEKELQRAKYQIKGNLLLGLESVSARMSRLGKSELYLGEIRTPEEIVARVNAVNTNDIFDIVDTMLDVEDYTLAAIGPWENDTAPTGITDFLDKA